ncbi:helix-turn-helix domain-containing protein [Sphingobacterium sp. DK4209]|uniref:Helix-turn-helix domain-containing protein n=1 Tax=Sphingobacterium zhuxiongii TaxID=2662364 RepID=A0A5Q0Q9L6_9SPHI|nr:MULTISPECIES: AraC family transcriptional regulator [unclassified Sphingobacterium]MVZ66603.1 helix-turn-helix domain-containing protein [Sphingobacterium sp. DK4209]QGA26787.1 helix-turn-helix domain-containing protein [Sphingobacterium sp. dk4302]
MKEITNKSKIAQNIKVRSNDSPFPSAEIQQKLLLPRRLTSYFIVLIESGSITYKLDLQEITLTTGDLLFAMPNQYFIPPTKTENLKYFKILFDENTLALLPQRFSFLINPLNSQIITLENHARERVRKVIEIINQILYTESLSTDSEIILAYLNLLLSELNNAYFKNETNNIINSNFSKFVEFKLMVETHLTEQPSINAIAQKMALTTNSLYRLVKEYSGSSPKDFLTNRLKMEAQWKLRNSKLSVKELAYALGFNDPDYFSRLFKKSTGKSVSDFLQHQDLSRE